MKKFSRYAFKAAIVLFFLVSCTVNVWNLGEAEARQGVLTSTLGTPIGMQGFTGAYALNNSQEIVEIIVQFVTPPSTALRLMQERGIAVTRMMSSASPRAQALTAHNAFEQQLSQMTMPSGTDHQIEIFGEHHMLFNGVSMRVPAWMVERVSALAEVFAVFPNMAISAASPSRPQSIVFPNSFPHNNAARLLFNIDHIHNTLGFTGDGVTVAVLDSGIDGNHPDLARYRDPGTGRIRGWNFVNNNNNLSDLDGHGTHVSGTVVAMAPDIDLWHYRVLNAAGVGTLAWIMDAVERAWAEGADIINLSLGIRMTATHHPLNHAVNLATLDGVICVISSGNVASTLYVLGTSPLPIIVGAGTAGGEGWTQDTIATFSSRGPSPEIFHIKPDIIAPGVAIRSTAPGGGYDTWDGTSMAAPAVTGIAALMLEAFPDAAPYEIKARIMSSARPLADLTPSTVFTVGAGFIYPTVALTATGFITTRHEVPWGASPDAFETHTMSSFSFGSLQSILPDNVGTISGMVHNTTNLFRTLTIGYNFTNNPNSAASITLSRTNVNIGPRQTVDFAATISFNGTVPGGAGTAGFYEGYIYVEDGGITIASLPFGLVNPAAATVPAFVLDFDLGTNTSPIVPASIEPINVYTGANIQNFITNHHRGFTHRYGGFPQGGHGPTSAGYEFAGWYIDSAFATPLTAATMTSDTTLYANWTPLPLNTPPQVLSHPESQTITQRNNQSKTASFSVTATGSAPLAYQWQRSNDGFTWSNITGATEGTYSLTVQAADDGAQFRVLINNADGNATSNIALLNVIETEVIRRKPLQIMDQPQNLRVNAGDTASFNVVVYGATYFQWQRMRSGRWRDIDGANAATYSFIAQSADSGSLFRAMVSNDQGREISSTPATLAVNAGSGGGASTSGSSSGCNTSAGLIAFALAGAMAFVKMKKN